MSNASITIFYTTYQVVSYEWWRCESTIFSSPPITFHMASCGKTCVKCLVLELLFLNSYSC